MRINSIFANICQFKINISFLILESISSIKNKDNFDSTKYFSWNFRLNSKQECIYYPHCWKNGIDYSSKAQWDI